MKTYKKLKTWMIDVMALLDEDERHLIEQGMEIYHNLLSGGFGTPNQVKIKLGRNAVTLPWETWNDLNELMKTQRYHGGASYKVQAIKQLRQYVFDHCGYRPGLKDSKDAVEDIFFFPAV